MSPMTWGGFSMKDKCSIGKKKERGTALLFAIFLTLLLTVMGSTMILTWQSSKRSADSLQAAVQNHYLLEAGVADVLSYLDSQIQGAEGAHSGSTINCSDPMNWLRQFESAISDMKNRGKKYQIDLVSRPQDYTASQLAYQIRVTALNAAVPNQNPYVTMNFVFKQQTGADPFYRITGTNVAFAYNGIAIKENNSDTITNFADLHPEQSGTVRDTIRNAVQSFINSYSNEMANFQKNHPNPKTYTQGSDLSGDWMTNGDFTISSSKKQPPNSLKITNGSLYVNGNLTVDGTLTVDGDLYVNGNLSVNGTLKVGGNLYVSGQMSGSSTINVTGSLYAAGNVELSNTLTVNGDVVVNGSYNSSESTINGSLVVYGDTTMALQGDNDLFRVDGDILVDGDVNLTRKNHGNGHVQYQIGGHLVSTGTITNESTINIANSSVPINGYGGGGSSSLRIQSISY
jgi:cytoskeletal protein CcmA (bactofilin family)/Tfp pilus assembly protein PilX